MKVDEFVSLMNKVSRFKFRLQQEGITGQQQQIILKIYTRVHTKNKYFNVGGDIVTGDVYDYNDRYIRIMSGELRKIIFFKSDEEYQNALEKGMRIGKSIIFDNDTDEIIKFF